MISDKIRKNKENIAYGLSLAVLFLLLQWLEIRFVVFSRSFEIYIACIAIIFMAFGIWLAKKLTNPKIETIIIEKEKRAAFERNEQVASQLKISNRELEVLQLMANGLSNKEIADELFVSLNTIKSHSSNLFEKLEARRRTQAIENAKKLQLIQ